MGVAGRPFQTSDIDALPPDDQSAIREAPQQEPPKASTDLMIPDTGSSPQRRANIRPLS